MELGDVTIHYQEAGQGPLAFVFCHGLGENAGQEFVQEFDFWKDAFGRVVTWDNRGMGLSSPAAKYALPLYAGDLARLLDGLGVTRAVLLGFLWGGMVAQQFALDYPQKCAALVLDSTSSEVNVAASEAWYRRGEEARRSGGLWPQHLDSYVAACRTVAALREHPLTPRLKHITCPALIVAGGQDALTRGPGASVIMSRHLPNGRLQIFQDAGHGIFHERPQEFRALVVDFCKEHGIIQR